MKVSSKKAFSLVMVLMLVVLALAGCVAETDNTPVNESPNTDTTEEVMGKVNGEDITRDMLGAKLTAAEKSVVEQYINEYLLREYYKDIEVTDIEVEAQFTIVKGQIGEAQWESYLEYIGMEDEEAFKEAIRQDLKGTKKRDAAKADIELTEEEIEKHYTDFKNSFDLMVGKILFFDTEEEYMVAKGLSQEGKTLSEVSEETGKDIYENEHVSFEFDGFEVPMTDIQVGDTVYTKVVSGTFAIVYVEKIDNTFAVLKETVKEDLLNQKAQEKVNVELDSHYNNAKVTILGEEIQ